jgi:hypothetical protein
MAAEVRFDLHHRAPLCLLELFDAAAASLADWSEFDAEAERWGIEVHWGVCAEEYPGPVGCSSIASLGP